MAGFTEMLNIVITADSKGAVAGLGAVGKEAGITATNVGLMGKTWDKFKGAISSPEGTATAVALIGVVLTKAAYDAATAFSDATAEVRTFQRVAGGTAEDSSKLVFAMQRLGIDAETGAKAMQRLGRDVGDGKGKLDEWGIAVDRNRDGTTNLTGTLLNVSDAYVAIKDPAERATMAFDLFGRQGQSLNALLGQGSKELKTFFDIAKQDHKIFSQDDLDKGREFKRAMFDVESALQGLELEIGQAVIPVFTDLARAVTAIIHGIDDLKGTVDGFLGGGGLGSIGDSLISAVPVIGPSLRLVKDGVKDLSDSQDDGSAKAKEHAQHLQEEKQALDEITNSLKAATQAQWDQISAQLSAEGSILGVQSATEAYNVAVFQTGEDSLKSREALNNLETSIVSAAKAQGEAAAAALEPGASAQEKLQASTKASSEAFLYMAMNAAPAARDKLLAVGIAAGIIPPNVHTDVTADTSQAIAALQRYRDVFNALPLAAKNALMGSVGGRGFNLDGSPMTADGGVFSGAQMRVIGEAGPEAVIPLSRPARAAEIMAQAGLTGSRGGGNSYAISVTAGMGASGAQIGAQVVDAIKQFERRSGTSWRN